MANLRGGSTIGGQLIAHFKNLKTLIKRLGDVDFSGALHVSVADNRTIGSAVNLDNGWIKIGTDAVGLALDPNEIGFSGTGLIRAKTGLNLTIGSTGKIAIDATDSHIYDLLNLESNVWDNANGGGVRVKNSGSVGAGLSLIPSTSAVNAAGWALYAGSTGAAIGDGNIGLWNHGDSKYYMKLTKTDMYIGGANAPYKVWHQNNDGAGSGLDADLLDGKHATELDYVKTGARLTGDGGNNLVTSVRLWDVSTAGDAPSGATDGLLTTGMWDSSSWATQQYHDFHHNELYLRNRYSGTWRDWVKVWHTGNDGSGSGLDADLLDGLQGTDYVKRGYLSARTSADWNTIDSVGFDAFYCDQNSLNKPPGHDHGGITLSYSNAWSLQIAGDWRTNKWFVREQNNGTWGAWDQVWTAGTDGNGSGLDADMLEGYHAGFGNVANSVPIRDGSGDITTRLFRSEYTGEGWNGAYFLCQNAKGSGVDNYARVIPTASVKSTLGLTGLNIESWHQDAVAPTGTTRINYNGYLYATRVYNAVWNDFADFMEVAPGEFPKPGDIMMSSPEGLRVANGPRRNIVGVYSDTYGVANGAKDFLNSKGEIVLREDGSPYGIPIGVAGKVLIHLEDDSDVEAGDFITCSIFGEGKACIDNNAARGTSPGKIFDGVKQEDGRYWMMIALT